MIRHIGLSNVSAEQFAIAREMTEIAAVAAHFNVADRSNESLLRVVQVAGAVFVPWQPVSLIPPRRCTDDPTITNYHWGDLTAARFEAKDRGARTAILLDSDGCVAEGPGFNVIVVKDGSWRHPLADALPGITRRTVFEIAAAMNVEAEPRDVTGQELCAADELIAVTTAGGVTPIVSLDREPVGDGTPGSLTVALRTGSGH